MQFSEEKDMTVQKSSTCIIKLVSLKKNNISIHTTFIQNIKNHSKMVYAEKVSSARGRTTKKLFPGHVKIEDDLSNFLLSGLLLQNNWLNQQEQKQT